MSQATANKDDDLIILSDEVTSNDDFNFDFLSNTTTEPTTDLIDFNTEVKAQTLEPELNFDFSFDSTPDLTFDSSVSSSSTTESLSTQEVVIEQGLDLETISFEYNSNEIDLFETPSVNQEIVSEVTPEILPIISKVEVLEEVKTEVVENSNTALLGDRNDILNETIIRLEKRKEVISGVKGSKQDNVTALKEKIAELKSQVSLLEGEIKDLEREEGGIDVDISTIEKMKSVALDSVSERPRKHNLDNIKKTK